MLPEIQPEAPVATIEQPTAESPFTEDGFQFAWDSVTLGTLKECPRKYQLAIVEGWQPRRKSVHLGFGSHLHKALERFETYINSGLTREFALEAVLHLALIESADLEPDKAGKKTREALASAIVDYADDPKIRGLKTLKLDDGTPATELSFRKEITFDKSWTPIEGRESITFCGHIDRMVEFQGFPYVADTKSTGMSIGTEKSHFFDQFTPDSQFSGYAWAAREIYGVPVRGVIVDGIQIAKGFTRFERGIAHRTPAQLEEWRNSLFYWVKAAAQHKLDGFYPMNEKSCHKFGGCVFKSICSKDPHVRQRFLETDYERRPWNPLAPRTSSLSTTLAEPEDDE